MGIIKKDGIIYSGPSGGSGGGGGGTPVEYIEQSTYEELYEEGTWEPDTLYLVMYNDSITIYGTFYNGEFYPLARGTGTYVTDMDIDDWNLLIEDVEDPVWDNCSLGYYFIWSTDGDNKSLVKIAHVYEDEGHWGSYIYPLDDNRQMHLMLQSTYDTIIDDGGIPVGFSYCTDTRNLYYEDQVIVENTPPVP